MSYSGAASGEAMRTLQGSTKKLLHFVNTPSRNSTFSKTHHKASQAVDRDPVRQQLGETFDRVAAARPGVGGPSGRLAELQRDMDMHRSLEKGASNSGRADMDQLHVSGSAIRAFKPASRAEVRWAHIEPMRPASSPEMDTQRLQHGTSMHQGGAVHQSLDLGELGGSRFRDLQRALVRNSEVSVHDLLGRHSSDQFPDLQDAPATTAADSPIKAVLERHAQRRGARGSPRRTSRLHQEDPPGSPDGTTARRARSQSPRKKPALARLDVENLGNVEAPGSFSTTPNRAALGDVTPSRNWQVWWSYHAQTSWQCNHHIGVVKENTFLDEEGVRGYRVVTAVPMVFNSHGICTCYLTINAS